MDFGKGRRRGRRRGDFIGGGDGEGVVGGVGWHDDEEIGAVGECGGEKVDAEGMVKGRFYSAATVALGSGEGGDEGCQWRCRDWSRRRA